MRLKYLLTLIITALVLTACAPENLDITPSPTPTNTPDPQATESAEVETTTVAEVSSTQGLLDQLIAAVPARLTAGAIQWNRTRDEPTFTEEAGGVTGRIAFSEAGGGAAELTFGAFDTPEAAAAYYEIIRNRLRTLENARERDQFPLPNAFGGGTYGSDAVFQDGNLFVRISVPRFSSTYGDPLVPFARTVFALVEDVRGT